MGLYVLPEGYRAPDEDQQKDPEDVLLQDFLAALQEPEESPIQPPRPLSQNERIYLAFKGARDPEFRRTVVDPMLAERRNYPARAAMAAQSSRQQRRQALGQALGAVSSAKLREAQAAAAPVNAAARATSAEASKSRAEAAVKRGGKVHKIIEAVKDAAGNIVGSVNAAYVEDVDEAGKPILRRIQMVSPGMGEGGETVSVPGSLRPNAPITVTDATGTQKLVDRYTGKEVAPKIGQKQPSPGIQTAAARAISTVAGFDDFTKVYSDYQTTQLGANPSLGSRLLAQGRGALGERFPKVGEVVDIPTSNFITFRQAALNRYIKDVTGAQFSIKELDRYERQLPGPGAPPESAIPKIRALLNQSLEQLRAFILQNGGLKAMISSPALQKRLEEETDFSFTPPAPEDVPKLEAWLAGGTEAQSAQPKGGGLPVGIPVGSKRVGRSRTTGKPLWRSPDGKLHQED